MSDETSIVGPPPGDWKLIESGSDQLVWEREGDVAQVGVERVDTPSGVGDIAVTIRCANRAGHSRLPIDHFEDGKSAIRQVAELMEESPVASR